MVDKPAASTRRQTQALSVTVVEERGPSTGRRQRLAAVRRKSLLAVHIASSVALLGTSTGLLITAVRAATRSETEQAHTLYELMRLLTHSLGIPFSFIALITGALLGLSSKWGLVRYWWVAAKLALLVATIATGALLTGPSIDTMLDISGSAGHGDDSATWTLAAAVGAQIGMVLAATVLAVFKPGGRMRWPQPPTSLRPNARARALRARDGADITETE
jgi:hypothetical protein